MNRVLEYFLGDPKKDNEIIRRDELLQEIEELSKISGIKVQGMKGPVRDIEALNLQGKAHLNNIAYELGRECAPLKDIQEVQTAIINRIESFKEGVKDLRNFVRTFEKKVEQLSKLVQKNEFGFYRGLSNNVRNYRSHIVSISKNIETQLNHLSSFIEHYEKLKDKSKEEEKMLKAKAKKRKPEPTPHPSGFKVHYDDKRNPYTESRRDQVDPKSKKQKKDSKSKSKSKSKSTVKSTSAMEVMIDLSKQYAPKNVLSESSTSAEIKKAYKKIALKLHPDKVPKEEQQRAQAEFQILNNAFENLEESGRVKAGAKGKKKKKQTNKKKGGARSRRKSSTKRKKNLYKMKGGALGGAALGAAKRRLPHLAVIIKLRERNLIIKRKSLESFGPPPSHLSEDIAQEEREIRSLTEEYWQLARQIDVSTGAHSAPAAAAVPAADPPAPARGPPEPRGDPIMGDTEMPIYIQKLNGETFEIMVRGTGTISDVKDKIQEKKGIPPGQQRLIFGGRQMEDYRALQDYNVQRSTTLRLVLKKAAEEEAPRKAAEEEAARKAAEERKRQEPLVQEIFTMFDANGDGKLSKDEYEAYLRALSAARGGWGFGPYTDEKWDERWPKECGDMESDTEGIGYESFEGILYGKHRLGKAQEDLASCKLALARPPAHAPPPPVASSSAARKAAEEEAARKAAEAEAARNAVVNWRPIVEGDRVWTPVYPPADERNWEQKKLLRAVGPIAVGNYGGRSDDTSAEPPPWRQPYQAGAEQGQSIVYGAPGPRAK